LRFGGAPQLPDQTTEPRPFRIRSGNYGVATAIFRVDGPLLSLAHLTALPPLAELTACRRWPT
jgi:hypothetical protein